VAAWVASSLVGHMTRTIIGGRFWSRSRGGDFTTTSIDGSWKKEVRKIVSKNLRISDS
jgi:hypothetical protein